MDQVAERKAKISTNSRAWLKEGQWAACGDASLTVEQVAHLPCVMGVDVSSDCGVTSFVKLFMGVEYSKNTLM